VNLQFFDVFLDKAHVFVDDVILDVFFIDAMVSRSVEI